MRLGPGAAGCEYRHSKLTQEVRRHGGGLSRVFGEGSVAAADTPTGDVPATGRLVDFRWLSAYEALGDELASEHLFFDQVELLTQLGLM